MEKILTPPFEVCPHIILKYLGNRYQYERTDYKNGNFSSVVTSLNKILIGLLILYILFTFHTIKDHFIAKVSPYNFKFVFIIILIYRHDRGNHYRYERTLYKNGSFFSVVTYLNKIFIVLSILYILFTFHTIKDQILAKNFYIIFKFVYILC